MVRVHDQYMLMKIITQRQYMIIYKNIRDLREDSDIKQNEIAKILGIAQNTYSQYETGKIQFTGDMLIALADFYDTTVDYLLGRTTERKPK